MGAILASHVHSRILQLPVWFRWRFVCVLAILLVAVSTCDLKKMFPAVLGVAFLYFSYYVPTTLFV